MSMPDGQTLLRKTYTRALEISPSETPLTVTNREYLFASRDELALVAPTLEGKYLLEPEGRNTAGAITLAALHLQATVGDHAVMLVLPADHLILNTATFKTAVVKAHELAQQGYLVTFGIEPQHPETGFGYIKKGAPLELGFEAAQFIEKPSVATATLFVRDGQHLWNAGMFCMQVSTFLSEMEQHAHDVLNACAACLVNPQECALPKAQGLELRKADYEHVPSISIDHALMERSKRVAVVPSDMGWTDIGSWSAVRQIAIADAQGNASTTDSVFVNCTNTYVHGDGRLVATVGTNNLIIVDTPDALLVCDLALVQEVREIVRQLKVRQHPAYKLHQTVARPWGTYKVLNEGPLYKVKRIEVKPGASLSLQMHQHRNEHWIVVSGVAEVTNGERVFLLQANESTYIPAKHKHRLTNLGQETLIIIEVQSGAYLGEDDILRFEDIYGRTHTS
jgi:mannose-1-phosphate guanylyltransferase